MTAHFVDAHDVFNRAIWRVQPLHCFIARCADCFHHTLVDFILRIERQHLFARNIDNHLAERYPAQLSIFTQKPRNKLIDRRLRLTYDRVR